jgi:hypothetical protein
MLPDKTNLYGNDGELVNAQFCIHCGEINSIDARRCDFCRKPLSKRQSAPVRELEPLPQTDSDIFEDINDWFRAWQTEDILSSPQVFRYLLTPLIFLFSCLCSLLCVLPAIAH